MKKLTHNEVPEALEILIEKVSDLETYIKNQPPPEKARDIIGAKEAADLLGITLSTVYSKTHKHEIPFRKMENSSKLLFSRAELTAWISQNKYAA